MVETSTSKIPRGLPEEQPVEVVAVPSTLVRLGVVLVAVQVLLQAALLWAIYTTPFYTLVR